MTELGQNYWDIMEEETTLGRKQKNDNSPNSLLGAFFTDIIGTFAIWGTTYLAMSMSYYVFRGTWPNPFDFIMSERNLSTDDGPYKNFLTKLNGIIHTINPGLDIGGDYRDCIEVANGYPVEQRSAMRDICAERKRAGNECNSKYTDCKEGTTFMGLSLYTGCEPDRDECYAAMPTVPVYQPE